MALSVSVLIPSVRPLQLPACLRGLEAQTFKPLEVFVVWQGSDDGTRRAAECFAAGSALTLKILHSQEKGIVAAENAALDRASGDIIALLDDDAVPPPDWLARHMSRYADPDIGAAGGPVSNFFPDGRPFPRRSKGPLAKLTWYGRSPSNMFDHEDAWRARPPEEVDFLMGANLTLRRKAFGRFEAGLKPYWQDFEVDACYQVRGNGYRALFDFTNVVAHYPTNQVYAEGRTGDLELKLFNGAYNQAFVLSKHSRGALKRLVRLAYLLLVGTRNAPGPLMVLLAIARHGDPLRELGMLGDFWRSRRDGWRAGAPR